MLVSLEDLVVDNSPNSCWILSRFGWILAWLRSWATVLVVLGIGGEGRIGLMVVEVVIVMDRSLLSWFCCVKVDVEEGMVEEGMVEEGMVEEGIVEEGMVEEGMVEEGMVEEEMVKEGMMEVWRLEEGMDEAASKEGAPEAKVVVEVVEHCEAVTAVVVGRFGASEVGREQGTSLVGGIFWLCVLKHFFWLRRRCIVWQTVGQELNTGGSGAWESTRPSHRLCHFLCQHIRWLCLLCRRILIR